MMRGVLAVICMVRLDHAVHRGGGEVKQRDFCREFVVVETCFV